MVGFWFYLVVFGGGGEVTKSGERFDGINEGGIVSGVYDVLEVAKVATAKDAV